MGRYTAMGICAMKEQESPFDAIFADQMETYKAEIHKSCVNMNALADGVRKLLPEVREFYDANSDGTLQKDEFDHMMREFFGTLDRWVPKYVDVTSDHLIKMAKTDEAKIEQLKKERAEQISLWSSTIAKWSDPTQCPEHLEYFERESVMTKEAFLSVMATRINNVWENLAVVSSPEPPEPEESAPAEESVEQAL